MITELLAAYTRDLLDHDASLIVIGRENVDKANSSDDYIAVDELVSIPAGASQEFDGNSEEQTFSVQMKGDFTINFFGDNARANAVKWVTLHGNQESYELQRDLGFAVYHATSFRNLKNLEGSQYKNRYEIEISLYFNETTTIDTLRIDTSEITFIVDN
jgi:hypothetical protein